MRLILALAATLALTGCDAIDDMKGAFDNKAKIEARIKEKRGWTTMVGFNINNGTLTQVTVHYQIDEVRKESVATLEAVAVEEISAAFKSKPKFVNINVTNMPLAAP